MCVDTYAHGPEEGIRSPRARGCELPDMGPLKDQQATPCFRLNPDVLTVKCSLLFYILCFVGLLTNYADDLILYYGGANSQYSALFTHFSLGHYNFVATKKKKKH